MSADYIYYLRVLIIGCIAGMHLAVMDMFKVAFKTFLEELGMIKEGNATDVVLDEYSKIYSIGALINIPVTLFWGNFTDHYGRKLSLNLQGFGTVMIFVMLSMTNSYSMFFLLMISSSIFDNYIVALDTFFNWVPEHKKISYIRSLQLVKNLLMQSGPALGGILTSLPLTSHLSLYHRVLAIAMLSLLIAFNIVFKDVREDDHNHEESQPKTEWHTQIDDEKERIRNGENPEGLEGEFSKARERQLAVKDSCILSDTNVTYEAVKIGPPEEEAKIEQEGFVRNFRLIWQNKNARWMILLGLYLRMAKKYVDYGFHLWAEIKREENGLGLNNFILGTCSSLGGISSVFLYLLIFSNLEMKDLPRLIKKSLFFISLTIFTFPLLVFLRGFMLDVAVFGLILCFMISESIVFSGWIGLLNSCLPKHIRARSYSLALTIKGCLGFFCSYFIFEGFRWSLNSPLITKLIGPLNSAIFFWIFGLGSLAVLYLYKDLKLDHDKGIYTLTI